METANVDVSAVYDKILMITGGESVPGRADQKKLIRKSPTVQSFEATCGASMAHYVVYVVKVNIDIADIKDAEEDTKDAKLKVNSDDDDCSDLPDKDDPGEVKGENDLIPITLTVEPAGAKGTLTLDTSGAPKLKVWKRDDRSETTPLTWDLADVTQPGTLWVEGLAASETIGDQLLKGKHDWCDVHSEDSVKATVEAREGNSEAWFGLYRKTGDGPNDYLPLKDPIGGVVCIGVNVKIGAGERLQDGQGTMTVRVREESDLHTDPQNRTEFTPVNLTSATGWYKLTNPCGTTPETWAISDKAPNYDNHDERIPLVLRTFIEWDTKSQPLGHNEKHSILSYAINGDTTATELTFEKWQNPGWGSAYESGPSAITAEVKNLVITSVRTGNYSDYFPYYPADPDFAESVSFTIDMEDNDLSDAIDVGLRLYSTTDPLRAYNR